MLRLPSFRLPRLRYDRVAWVVFLLATGVIVLSSVARKKDSFSENVEVEVVPMADGAKLITENDVKNALAKAFGNTLEGTQIRDLEVERIERTLEEDPFVQDANAFVDAQTVLHVRIQQREPLLRILDNNGGNYYLDRNGARMPASKNYAARVIVATGNIPPYTPDFQEKKKHKIKDLFALTNRLLADEFLRNFIQQIHVNSAGDILMVPLVGDQKIVLGTMNHLESKLRRLKIFYREGMPYAGWQQYETINLKFNGQVVCKK